MVDTPPAEASEGRSRGWLMSRPAPATGAALLAAGAALVAANDPSATGSRFPACTFRTWTGLWCPGCGLTRATHELFQGNIGAALGHNLFVPIALVGIVLAWWAWFASAWGVRFMPQPIVGFVGTPGSSRRRRSDRALWSLFALLMLYGVLRNIPVEPFTALAP
jgi:hypothetical protein